MLLPSAAGNPSAMIAQALAIYKQLSVSNQGGPRYQRKTPQKEITEETPLDAIPESFVSEGTDVSHGSGFSLQSPTKGPTN